MADADARTDVASQAGDNNSLEESAEHATPPSPGPEEERAEEEHRDRGGDRMNGLFRDGPDESSSENVEPRANHRDDEFSLLVVLQPDGVRHRVLVTTDTTVQGLADQIARDLRLHAEVISFPDLEPAPGLTQSETTLGAAALDGSPGRDSVVASVARKLTSSDYVMPDVIQVQLLDDETQTYRTVAVEIVKFTGRKPYLGGFRHRKTQQIFHHAACQTLLTRAKRDYGPRAHRDTQTQVLVTRSAQTTRESGTQMERRGVRLDASRDRTVTAQPYFDSHQLRCLQEDSVLLVQRLLRGHQARAYVHLLREQRRSAAASTQRALAQHAVLDAEYQQHEVHRRMHPKTVGDFEVLYNELDKWRQVETRKVHEDRALQQDASARQRALEAILAKETKLLQTIDRLKLTANDANRRQRIESMLRFMSRPKQWQMSDGGVKEVHTPFTVRAKELLDLYHGLRAPLAAVDERLDVLLHVKWTVQEFDCALTREIVELIDREADMLNRGRKEKSLEGLRKRLQNLFLQFVETPQFNPEAAVVQQQRRAGGQL